MKIYLSTSPKGRWWATAPEVPGAAAEDVGSREEALSRSRSRARIEREALERLGARFEIGPAEEIIDWAGPWWLIPEWLQPVKPAVLRAAVRRMEELTEELERFVRELDAAAWDRREGGEWSVRMCLDHVAHGFGIGIRRLERWPLDPAEGQERAIEELRSRLAELVGQRFAVEQWGFNQESGRVRWTPRKVLRVVSELQEATLSFLRGTSPEPTIPMGHEDRPGDEVPLRLGDLGVLVERDSELRRFAEHDNRAREIATSYRYYRDRLIPWPSDVLERFRAMRDAFRVRLLSLDETELAIVRVAPDGFCSTVNQNLGLGISHVREHWDQMRRAVGA